MKAKKKSKPLPETVYVFRANEGQGEDEYLSATDIHDLAIDDDGPTLVGTYTLTGTERLIKRIVPE